LYSTLSIRVLIMSKIESILKRYQAGRKESLTPILQDIQAEEGYLSEEAVITVGKFLGISTTKIFGLATFYDQFRFVPSGKVHLRICNGTTCFLNGSGQVVTAVKDAFGIDPGQTTRDGKFSFEIVPCMGGCNDGPVIKTGDKYYTRVKAEDIPEMVKKLRLLAEI
jgi:NADH:ubiquinone oxidoreductase subunit E